MIQLWDDLRTHVIATTQTKGDDSSRYYLGSIVIDSHSGVDHLVDGQQRFTTLSLIACAIRDALITSGFTEEAYEIHHGLIRNMDDGIDDRNRFELFDKPRGDSRSFERRFAPYRKRMVNIPTGLVTAVTAKGSTRINIDGKASSEYVKWSTDLNEKWELGLSDGKRIIAKYKVTGESKSRLRFGPGGNPPDHIPITKKTTQDIGPGLEVLLLSDIDTPIGKDEHKPVKISNKAPEKKMMNQPENSDLYWPDYRNFYQYVRADAEHFIQGEKSFYPTKGIRINDAGTTLKLHQQSPLGELEHCGRMPREGEILTFYEEVQATKEWPTDDELFRMIENDESGQVELKGCFSNPSIQGIIRKNSKKMKYACTRAVASFLNTRGGYLFIGVQDETLNLTGINHENYSSHDKACGAVIDYIKRQLGARASKYIEAKVIVPEGLQVEIMKEICNMFGEVKLLLRQIINFIS